LIVLTILLVISFSACSLLVVADFAVLFYFVVCKSFAAVCQWPVCEQSARVDKSAKEHDSNSCRPRCT